MTVKKQYFLKNPPDREIEIKIRAYYYKGKKSCVQIVMKTITLPSGRRRTGRNG